MICVAESTVNAAETNPSETELTPRKPEPAIVTEFPAAPLDGEHSYCYSKLW